MEENSSDLNSPTVRSIFSGSEINFERSGSNRVIPAFSHEPVDGIKAADSFSLDNKSDGSTRDQVAIKLENVHKTYLIGAEGVAALRGVSFTVNRGDFVCILGTSGGGKTTLLNIMGTIDTPTKGHVWIFGSRIKSNTSDRFLAELRLKRVAFVFQTFNLISSMTALENVELPMLLWGKLSPSEIRLRARELLGRVGLSDRCGHFPNMLSGGEQQRVTIARALANDPDVLLLDEPTGDLDTKNTDIVMKILLDLNKEGKTLVMVTHDIGLKSYAHKVVRVMDGKLIRQEEVTDEERHLIIEKHGENGIALRTGTNQILTNDMPKTMFRKPQDYPALHPGVNRR